MNENVGKFTLIDWFLISAVQFLCLEWSAAEKRISDDDCFTCLASICIRWLLTLMSMMLLPRIGIAVMLSPRRTCSGSVAS